MHTHTLLLAMHNELSFDPRLWTASSGQVGLQLQLFSEENRFICTSHLVFLLLKAPGNAAIIQDPGTAWTWQDSLQTSYQRCVSFSVQQEDQQIFLGQCLLAFMLGSYLNSTSVHLGSLISSRICLRK